jgi:hypothetical protein
MTYLPPVQPPASPAGQKATNLLDIWAGMFTDNFSEYEVDRLYRHYAKFVWLFHERASAVPFGTFRAYTEHFGPMGLHDSEDTRLLIEKLATRYRGPGWLAPAPDPVDEFWMEHLNDLATDG